MGAINSFETGRTPPMMVAKSAVDLLRRVNLLESLSDKATGNREHARR